MYNILDESSNGDLMIRFVKEEDAVQLIELQMRLASETDFLMRELDEVEIDAEKQRDEIRRSQNDENRFLVGVYDQGRLIGYLAGHRGQYARNKHVASIVIGVLKDYWGKGHARQLMDAFIQWAVSVGIHRLEVEVVEDNDRAMGYFYQYGFKIEGKKEADHLVKSGAYLNTFIMAKIMNKKIM